MQHTQVLVTFKSVQGIPKHVSMTAQIIYLSLQEGLDTFNLKLTCLFGSLSHTNSCFYLVNLLKSSLLIVNHGD